MEEQETGWAWTRERLQGMKEDASKHRILAQLPRKKLTNGARFNIADQDTLKNVLFDAHDHIREDQVMAFTDTQVQALSGKLSAKHVRSRQANGRTLSYIEDWQAIAEANRIFGFDAWDRQTMAIKCVWEGTWPGKYSCAYVARVRVKARAGSVEICREGCCSGHGRGNTPGEAHESALKEAEPDAMKRALTTFGNSFGLALYDKAQHGVRGKPRKQKQTNGLIRSWIVLSAEGEVISLHEDPVDYCKALRQVIEASVTPERLRALWGRNTVTIEMLRTNLRDLRTEAGEHYADILLSLYQRHLPAPAQGAA